MARRTAVVAIVAATLLVAGLAGPSSPADARTDPMPVAEYGTDLGTITIRPQGTPEPGTTFDGPWSSTRDCGMTARLSNGRTLWVFCDTVLFDETNTQRGIVTSSTATLGSWDDPTVVEDVLTDGRITALVPPQQHFPCTGFRAAWPHGVLTLPDTDGIAATDRIAIWFENVCHYKGSGDAWVYEANGVGVAVLDIDLRRGPRPMQATVLEPELFPADPALDHQFGAVLGPPGRWDHAHLYACESEGSCTTRRVDVTGSRSQVAARLADPAAYRSWDGSAWGPPGTPLAPVITGVGPTRLSKTELSVTWVPRLQRYVAAYLPWPGINDRAVLVTAPRPEGPWSAPTIVPLPSCGSIARCYALNVHAHGAGSGEVAVSYLRGLDFFGTRLDGSSRWFARAHLATVPLGPARPACTTADDVRFEAEVQAGTAVYRWRTREGAWWSWLELPGGPYVGRPAMVTTTTGDVHVVLTHRNGELWRLRRAAGQGFDAPTLLTSGLGATGEVAAVTQATGTEVFALDRAGQVQRIWLPAAGGAQRTGPVLGLPGPVVGLDVTGGPDGHVTFALLTADGAVHALRRDLGGWRTYPTAVLPATVGAGVAVHEDVDGLPTATVIDRFGRPTTVTWPADGPPTTRRTGAFVPVAWGLAGCTDPDGRAVVVATAPDLMAGRHLRASEPGHPDTMGPAGRR